MTGTKFKQVGTAYTNPFENLERKEVKIKVGSERIARIVFLNGDGAETNSVKQFVNLSRSASFVDGKIVPNIDRAGAKVRLKVYFNKPGTHRFTVRCEPLDGNAKYTPGELARNTRFGYQKEQKSYITGSDGSLVLTLDDFYVGAAGKDRYVFRATDANGITVSTGTLEVHRLIYYVELKMRSLTTCAKNLALVERTYEKHRIRLEKLPVVEIAHLHNIGEGDEQLFLANARSAYSKSLAVGKQPQVVAIAYTNHLAVKMTNLAVPKPSVRVGPGSSPVEVVISRYVASQLWPVFHYLWQGIVPGESWFVSASFLKDGGKPGDAIRIPVEKCTPVPDGHPQKSKQVRVDVSWLPRGTGTIELVVNVVQRMRGGLSFSSNNLICVCTKAWWKDTEEKMQNEVIIHELGHKLGMVSDGTGKLPDKIVSLYDYKKGHVGNHCFYGLSASQNNYGSRSDLFGSKCVMYGDANGKSDFCVNCAPAVLKADLTDGWRPF